MREKLAGIFVIILVAITAFCVFNQGSHAQEDQRPAIATADASPAQQSLADRGKYIVHHVAMCIYCHTPRNEQGVLDEQQLLQGAPMPVSSPFSGQPWAFQAPKIAGLPGGWTAEDLAKFLQSGDTPTGHQPQPPMPPFRFNDEDAKAVAAYLKSLE
jgi:mono/diheme cytochrome c family protein